MCRNMSNLKDRLTVSPVTAFMDGGLFSPRMTTRVVAIASIPSVTELSEYSRRVTGTCKWMKIQVWSLRN